MPFPAHLVLQVIGGDLLQLILHGQGTGLCGKRRGKILEAGFETVCRRCQLRYQFDRLDRGIGETFGGGEIEVDVDIAPAQGVAHPCCLDFLLQFGADGRGLGRHHDRWLGILDMGLGQTDARIIEEKVAMQPFGLFHPAVHVADDAFNLPAQIDFDFAAPDQLERTDPGTHNQNKEAKEHAKTQLELCGNGASIPELGPGRHDRCLILTPPAYWPGV
ncbi:MAG: hypothetical protein ACD_75C01952G0002 [uncultured bacterium]|nr:MAG: hypothetical protein ACD_75C01952G0002 [uncultured bacterium]